MSHTPGPWTFGHDNGCYWVRGPANLGPQSLVVELPSNGWSDPCAEADARIIAAAPDLLTALRTLTAAAPAFRAKPMGAPNSEARRQQDAHVAAEDAARAVIARATGTYPGKSKATGGKSGKAPGKSVRP